MAERKEEFGKYPIFLSIAVWVPRSKLTVFLTYIGERIPEGSSEALQFCAAVDRAKLNPPPVRLLAGEADCEVIFPWSVEKYNEIFNRRPIGQ